MAEATGQGITAELFKTIVTIVDQRIGEIKVAREEFDSLRAVVTDLAKAQAGTERPLTSLTTRVEELTEAQAKTEARLDSLATRVEELAEAQAKTEARLDSLARRVEELTEAQVKTEEILQGVIKEQKNMKKEIGGISATIGYTLYRHPPCQSQGGKVCPEDH